MSEKEEAYKLYYRFYNEISFLGINNWFSISKRKAKKCSLICIDEIIETSDDSNEQRFLEQVKTEINLI